VKLRNSIANSQTKDEYHEDDKLSIPELIFSRFHSLVIATVAGR